MPAGHRDRPVHEVPEIVRKVRVVAPDEAVPGDVAVAIEGDLAERDVSHPVRAERGHHVDRVEDVPAALAHPLALDRQESVDPDLSGRFEPGAPEHHRPEDRVEPGDVLADDVEIRRPRAGEDLRVDDKAGTWDEGGE